MDRVIMYTSGMSNGFFVIGSKGIVAVDTGAIIGEDVFLAQCEKAGLSPDTIKLLVATHGHVDHFFNLSAMKKITGAPVLCHKNAAQSMMSGDKPNVVARTSLGQAVLDQEAKDGPPLSYIPKETPDILIDDAYDLGVFGIEGKIIPTPGHTKGCISVVLDSGEAIVGDLYSEPAGTGMPGPAFFTYPGARFDEAQESIQMLLDLGVKTFYSGHGGPFSRETVRMTLERELKGITV